MNNWNIVPEKTAISNGISTSCKMLVNDNLHNSHLKTVLDYGCGKLRNSKFLIENNFKLDITDSPLQLKNNLNTICNLNINNYFDIYNIDFSIKYDLILVSFVLNTIPNIEERIQLLDNLKLLLNKDGYAYIEVRDSTFEKTLKNKIPHNDGLLTGNGLNKSFQKSYSKEELKEFLILNGFEVVAIKKCSNSIVAKIKKKGELM